ncbi:MAG: sensor histidine kinase [Eubacteriales bacterium]
MSIFVNALITTVGDHYLEQKKNHLQRQSIILTNQLISTGYMDGNISPNTEFIEYEINQTSKELDGRILLVDNKHSVLKDTNQVEEGKINISSEVIQGLEGNSSLKVIDNEMLQSIEPVKNDDEILGAVIITASIKDVNSSVNYLFNRAILLFIITLIIILTFSYYYSDLLTRPFKQLLKFIKKISEGHFDKKIDVKGHQEIEEIATAFNQMTKRLQEIDQSRQEFVSNVSHELRTPLASVKVLAESLLSQEKVSTELYKEFLIDINNEIERENKIINDLLSLVKMDKKEVALNIENKNINNLIEGILKRLKPLANQKEIEIIFESLREVNAEIDVVKLSLALTNLIENSIKYNRKNGWVKIILDADHKFFFLKIIDSGIGIPKDDQDKIFDRFYRVDKARSRESGGTGLGLSITKHAILMHKGFIKVNSKDNEGTTFIIRIPLHYIL